MFAATGLLRQVGTRPHQGCIDHQATVREAVASLALLAFFDGIINWNRGMYDDPP